MKAIQITKTGGPDVLEFTELGIPALRPDEALIELKAVGVNFIDIYFREGHHPASLPFIPGQEGAGKVIMIGSAVGSVKVGDRVAYTGIRGSYAEYAAIPHNRLISIPETMSYEEAAAALLQGLTAHYLTHSTYSLKEVFLKGRGNRIDPRCCGRRGTVISANGEEPGCPCDSNCIDCREGSVGAGCWRQSCHPIYAVRF